MKHHQRAQLLIKQLKNVTFDKSSFGSFLSSLEHQLILSEDDKSFHQKGQFYRWASLQESKIEITTDENPYLVRVVPELTLMGAKHQVQLVEQTLKRYASFDGHQILTESEHYKVNDTLNPKFWDGSELEPDVADALEGVVDNFVEFINIPSLTIKDVVITGSNANYNWTEYSDLDVHIIVNLDDLVAQYGELVSALFDTKRKLWKEIHVITIYDTPVELYIQDINEEHNSTGIYSLLKSKWIEQPSKGKFPTVDDAAVQAKVQQFKNKIEDIENKYSNTASDYEKLLKDIVKARKAGLSDVGEFSIENLAFKVLRNEGYLDRLNKNINNSIDRELSLEEEELEILGW